MARYLLPRLRDILFVAIFLGALWMGPRMLNTDSDLGRHLTLGNYILEAHRVPTRDLLSFTKPDQPRPPYEWLAQILFACASHLLNLDGVVLLAALIIATTFMLVYIDACQRSRVPVLALFLTAWAALASSLHWLTRPHIFSFLFFVIWILWLERIRTGERILLWQFPALMLVWANTHGGFIFGFLAWLAYFIGWLWNYQRKAANSQTGTMLLIIAGTSLIASAITPDLWHNWEAVLNNRSAYVLSHTAETMPPDFSWPNIWPFAGLLVLTIIFCFWQIKKVNACHLLLLAGLAFMSLLMARNIPFFVIAAAPILAEWTGQTLSKFAYWLKVEQGFARIDQQLRGFIWPILVCLATLGWLAYHYVETKTPINQFSAQVFPVQAVDWLKDHPLEGQMFNDFNWGGYLLYRLWPDQRVFVDSQSDFYGEAFMREYTGIFTGTENWNAELDQYHVSWIIIPRETGLAQSARDSTDWRIAYEDTLTVIFVQK
jgi:hypothetical protein